MKITTADKIICDICLAEIQDFDNNNTFSFKIGWQSGSHQGDQTTTGHVCDKCKGSGLRRWIAMKLFN